MKYGESNNTIRFGGEIVDSGTPLLLKKENENEFDAKRGGLQKFSLRKGVIASVCIGVSVLGISASTMKYNSSSGSSSILLGSTSLPVKDPRKTNLVLCKIPKVGGTTLAGVGRRIGEKYGLSGTRDPDWITSEPGVWMDHLSMQEGLDKKINSLQMDKFVFTLVRKPVERMISGFQYKFMDPVHGTARVQECYDLTKNPACTLPVPSTKKEIEDRLLKYVQYTNTNIESDYCTPTLGKEQNWSTNQIVDAMDFVGITERFDENLIVMKEIFNLEYSDILYLSANVIEYDWHAGTSARLGLGDNKESQLGEETLDPSVRAQIESMMKDSEDFSMWEYANKELDERVSQIPDFEKKLKIFTVYREAAQQHCAQYADKTGVTGQCMWEDQGCGEECLNEFAKDAQKLADALISADKLELILQDSKPSSFDFGDK